MTHPRLSPSFIEQYHLDAARTKIARLDLSSTAGILEGLQAQFSEAPNLALLREALRFAIAAASVGKADQRPELLEFSAAFCEELVRRYLTPQGGFVEYDRCTWLQPDDLWRTIPWGTGFRANHLIDAFQLFQAHLDDEKLLWWQSVFHRIGGWIHGNPVIGSFPFNCPVDLCRALWRIGELTHTKAYGTWALAALRERIARDLHPEGWCLGENGGCSGVYQKVGAQFLSLFALECNEADLREAALRMWDSMVGFSSPSFVWAGNFGTRSTCLGELEGEMVLGMAALGSETAKFQVQRAGEPAWSSNLPLWEKALSGQRKAPALPRTSYYSGINSTVLRGDYFTAWICDYEKSIWSKGFINLWSRELDDVIFSTLHSLPTRVEKSKLLLSETTDWAGMPHLQVQREGVHYHSHRKITESKIVGENGANWCEELMSDQEERGGKATHALTFDGDCLKISTRVEELAGNISFDYHVLRRPQSFAGIWFGEDVATLMRGELPRHGGWHSDRRFSGEAARSFAVQVDASLVFVEFTNAPEHATFVTGLERRDGLHTAKHSGSLGGLRIRLECEGTAPLQVDVSVRVKRCRSLTAAKL